MRAAASFLASKCAVSLRDNMPSGLRFMIANQIGHMEDRHERNLSSFLQHHEIRNRMFTLSIAFKIHVCLKRRPTRVLGHINKDNNAICL